MTGELRKREINKGDIKALRKVYQEVYDESTNPDMDQNKYLTYKKVMNNIKAVLDNLEKR